MLSTVQTKEQIAGKNNQPTKTKQQHPSWQSVSHRTSTLLTPACKNKTYKQ